MNENERYEVNNKGEMVVGIQQVLSQSEREDMLKKLFSINGWSYELISKSGSHFKIKLSNDKISKEYVLDLFNGNVRKEDPERSREEKKIQLGKDKDPRLCNDDGIILGIYVYEDKLDLENAIIVGFPIEQDKNYPANPSLRVNTKNDILVAKNIGFHIDTTTGKNLVAFRPEFIYYYLENYKEIHYSNNKNEPDKDDIKENNGSNDNINDIKFNTGYKSEFERNRIVFGAPGTGKSFTIDKDCKVLINSNLGSYERVTFHPDYSYSNFVGSYKPITKGCGDGNTEIIYEFVPGPFMRVYIEALKSGRLDDPQPHLLIIEEINRAKVASVFGDIFQLLDRSDSGVSEYSIQTSEDVRKYLAKILGGNEEDFKQIRIPDNMFIWATMNSADQGVYPMDTAFKRRWNFEYLGIDENDDNVKCKVTLGKDKYEDEVSWNKLRKAINEKMVDRCNINEDKMIGPYFLSNHIIKTVSETDNRVENEEKFKKAFRNKVIMYIYEDACRQHRKKIFEGCDSSKYSSICDAFDKKGIEIFGEDFKENFYQKQGV